MTLVALRIVIVVSVLFGGNVTAQVCSNPNNIFGLTSNGAIYPINISNASVGSKINTAAYSGASPNQSNAIGYNSINGKFYYFKVNPSSSNGGEFVSFDPTLQVYTTLTTSPIRATVHAGCVNFNGTGYYCTDVNGNLFYYNIASNSWTTITSNIVDQFGASVSTLIITQNSGDMAIDGLGNLWILTSSKFYYGLYEVLAPLPTTVQASVTANKIIDPATAVPASSSGFQGVAFNALGALYLTAGNNGLYQLTNKTAASLTFVGTLSTSGVGNDLTSCNFPFTVLPVVWSSFTVSLQNNNVSLDWKIAGAINVKGFYIERSNDNNSWNILAYVPYSEMANEYSYIDYNPWQGNNYYRIHEVDFKDEDNYSEIKLVNIASASCMQIAAWPNPVKDVLNIRSALSEDCRGQIFDQFGRLVSVVIIHSGNNQVNIGSLSTGNYFVHIVSANGNFYNEKIIKK